MGKYALILVLSLSFSIFAYNWGVRNTSWGSETRSAEVYSAGQAKNIAQSTAQIAISKIMNPDDSDFNPSAGQTISVPSNHSGFQPWSDLQGGYRLDITNSGDSLLVVNATGMFNEQEYSMQIQLESTGGIREWNPEFSKAVFSGEGIELGGSARILGHAGTNSTASGSVKLNSWAWPNSIEHNLLIGPGGDPGQVISSPNPNSIGGETLTYATLQEYPMPEFPQSPAINEFAASINLTGNSSMTLDPADYAGKFIPEISINSNTNLTINVGESKQIMHVGDLDVQQGHIHIVGNGSLEIYVDNDFSLDGSSSINSNGAIDQLFLYYKGTESINLAGNTHLKGGIYAETASISLGGSNSIEGHIITGGTNVTITGAASAHSRVIFAPSAFVDMSGSGEVTGAVIAREFKAHGNPRVYFSNQFNSELPPLRIPGNSGNDFVIRVWN